MGKSTMTLPTQAQAMEDFDRLCREYILSGWSPSPQPLIDNTRAFIQSRPDRPDGVVISRETAQWLFKAARPAMGHMVIPAVLDDLESELTAALGATS